MDIRFNLELELLPPILQDGRKVRKLYAVPNKQTKPEFSTKSILIAILHKSQSRIYIGIIAYSTCMLCTIVQTKRSNSNHIITKSELPRGNPKLYGYSILIPFSIVTAVIVHLAQSFRELLPFPPNTWFSY